MPTKDEDGRDGATWRGGVRMGLGWGVFCGRSGDNRPHAHHAVQVLLAASPQELWTPAAGWQRYRGLLIGANQQHRLAPTTGDVTLVYVEPDSLAGQRLQALLVEGIAVLGDDQLLRAQTAIAACGDAPLDRVLADALAAPAAGAALQSDAAITAILAALPAVLAERLPAASLARQAGLSTSRFLHRFRQHTGLPLRAYLRWRRLLTAMASVMRGEPLTDAALAAGFADVAHFNRTVRRHFGITPGMLLPLADGASQFVQDPQA